MLPRRIGQFQPQFAVPCAQSRPRQAQSARRTLPPSEPCPAAYLHFAYNSYRGGPTHAQPLTADFANFLHGSRQPMPISQNPKGGSRRFSGTCGRWFEAWQGRDSAQNRAQSGEKTAMLRRTVNWVLTKLVLIELALTEAYNALPRGAAFGPETA